MDHEQIIARLRRAKAIINNISVAGQQNWRALLVATGDIEAVEQAVAEAFAPAEQGPGVPGSANGTSPAELPPDELADKGQEE